MVRHHRRRNKVQRIFHITLPCISGTVILMFMLSFSGIFFGEPGTFDQSYFLGNSLNYERSYVLSYYVMKMGLMQGHMDEARQVLTSVWGLSLAGLFRCPQTGDCWRMNVYRCNHSESGLELTAWSPTGMRDFHVPTSFGRLIFE